MQGIWTEELAPVVVADSPSSQRLAARLVVTGVRGLPVHADVALRGELCAVTTPVVADALDRLQIGRAHVCTPVTNAHLVCRLLLAKQKMITNSTGMYTEMQ